MKERKVKERKVKKRKEKERGTERETRPPLDFFVSGVMNFLYGCWSCESRICLSIYASLLRGWSSTRVKPTGADVNSGQGRWTRGVRGVHERPRRQTVNGVGL